MLGREIPPSTVSFPGAREARLEALADACEEHLDLDALLSLATSLAPHGLPVVDTRAVAAGYASRR